MIAVEIEGVSVELFVHRFEAVEAVAESFEARLTISFHGEVPTSSFLRHKALVTIDDGDAKRHFGGVIANVKRRVELDTSGEIRHFVELLLRPSHHVLTLGADTRIFQAMSAIDIIEKVVTGGGLDGPKVEVRGSIPARDYCVQYEESDWDFVTRLAEDEGVVWISHHDEGGETLVFKTLPDDGVAIDGEAVRPFKLGDGAMLGATCVFDVSACEELRAGDVATAGYDFEKPALKIGEGASGKRETDRQIYEHTLAPRASPAKIRLEESTAASASISGRSTIPSLAPGRTFELAEHPLSELNRKWTVLRVTHTFVTHEAGAPAGRTRSYDNAFVAIAADAPYRPKRRTRKPRVPGALTATVTGPGGEEIHTDAHGRIKVQFHWDRHGKKDEHTTCWLRVAQPWAGQAFGAWFLPRVGHEVVVSFLEGDPDRPICTGSVYTGANVPPYPLPAEKTKSTIKTNSSPGGAGFNELRFEDKAGKEEIFLHAQRDWNSVVERRRTTRIVENDNLDIGAERTQKVGANETITIGASSTKQIGDTLGLNVGSSATVEVATAASVTVGAIASVTVGAALSQSVGGVYDLNVGAAHVAVIGGKRSETIGGSTDETIAGAATVTIAKDSTLSIGQDAVVKVAKTTTAELAGKVTGKASDDVNLELGDGTKLTIKKDGTVTLTCKKFVVKCDSDVVIKGSKIDAESSGGGILKAGGTLEVKGSTVKIN